MAIPVATLGRIRDIAQRIKMLEDRLMAPKIIPMSEQSLIHAEIRKYKEELDKLERHTRQATKP